MSLQATEPLVAGALVGDLCELLRPLSQGPRGTLWEAQDLHAPRKLAVLVPSATGPVDPAAAERLAREAQAASKTGHPGIAQVVHADTLPSGASLLILDTLPGESLATKLAKGPLSLDTSLRVGREIASALAAAHRESVAHGLLTADCVLLCPREEAVDQVKVLGFGLSALAGPAPDARADVAALARLVQQMLAEQPIAGPSEQAPSLEALSGQAPERVIASLRRALDPDLARQYPDVVAFMAECSGRAVVLGDGGFAKFAVIEEEPTVLKPIDRSALPAPSPETVTAPGGAKPGTVAETPAEHAAPKEGRGWTLAAALLAIAVAVGTLGFFALKSGPPPAPGAAAPAESQPAP